MAEVKSYKVLSLPSNPTPDSIYWVKGSSASDVIGYITDRQGVPYPLKDLQGSGGITTLVNTDGNLIITGADNKVINLAPALLSIINSALQSGDNISELVNDTGFITITDIPTNVSEFTNDVGYLTNETDPIFQASEASLFVAGDKANLDNQSGVNTGDETTLSIQTKRPLKTVNGESLEGSGNLTITIPTVTNTSDLVNDGSDGNSTYVETDELGATAFSNDYNDLDNKPTIPTPILNHSELNLDDGTNPHGTTKSDVGLGSVDNTSDVDKPISTATQVALDGKHDKVSTAGVERAYIINADGSQGTKPTSDFGGGDLQQTTDLGNTTTNSLILESANDYIEISPVSINIVDEVNFLTTSLNYNTIKNSDNLTGFSTNILFNPRTQNTAFYFEDEGGTKSIATREWVNANNYRKWLVKDTTPTTAVTGTTSLTQIGSSILIPANTFSAEDVMILEGFGLDRLTTFGTVAFRLFHNTTNSLTGATALSVSIMSQYNLTALARRTFEIEGGLLKCRIGTGSSSFMDFAGANLSPLSVSFNPAIDNYFFTTVQLSNASDSVTRRQLLISK